MVSFCGMLSKTENRIGFYGQCGCYYQLGFDSPLVIAHTVVKWIHSAECYPSNCNKNSLHESLVVEVQNEILMCKQLCNMNSNVLSNNNYANYFFTTVMQLPCACYAIFFINRFFYYGRILLNTLYHGTSLFCLLEHPG